MQNPANRSGGLVIAFPGSKIVFHPCACAGIGLYWLWVYLVMFSTQKVFYFVPPESYDPDNAFTVSVLVAMSGLLLLIGFSRRFRVWGDMKWRNAWVSGALRAAGSALYLASVICSSLFASTVVGAVAGVLAGLGSGALLLYWGRVFGQMGKLSTVFNTSIAFAGAMVAHYLLGSMIEFPLLTAVVIAMPLVESTLLAVSFRRIKLDRSDAQWYRTAGKLRTMSLVKEAILAVILGYTVSILRVLSVTSLESLPMKVGWLPILAAALLFALVAVNAVAIVENGRNQGKYNLRAPIVLVAITVIALFVIGDESNLTYTIVEAVGYYCLKVTVWSALVWFVYRLEFPPAQVLGIGLGFVFLGQLVNPLSNSFASLSPDPPTLDLLVDPTVLMFVLLLAVMLLSGEKGLRGIVGTSELSGESELAPSEDAVREVRITQLVRRYRLTDREREVIELVASGQSVAGISVKLCVTENTTKTHLKRIYRKTDVHSRQELIDLLDGADR